MLNLKGKKVQCLNYRAVLIYEAKLFQSKNGCTSRVAEIFNLDNTSMGRIVLVVIFTVHWAFIRICIGTILFKVTLI